MNASDAMKRARKLLAAATPWPWKVSGGYIHNEKSVLVESVPLAKKERGYAVAYLGDDAQTWKDGELIAEAPALIDRLCSALGAAADLEQQCWAALGRGPGEDECGHVETLPQAIAELARTDERLLGLRGAWKDFALSVSAEGLAKQAVGSRQAVHAYTSLRRAISEVLGEDGEP